MRPLLPSKERRHGKQMLRPDGHFTRTHRRIANNTYVEHTRTICTSFLPSFDILARATIIPWTFGPTLRKLYHTQNPRNSHRASHPESRQTSFEENGAGLRLVAALWLLHTLP